MDEIQQDIELPEEQVSIQFSVINEQIREIQYIKDGAILRLEKIEVDQKAEIIINLQQIKFLKWEGQRGNNNKKYGKWIPYWKMSGLPLGGIYDYLGLKQGIWRELDENFGDYSQISQYGCYRNSIKVGKWKIIFKNEIIGGGYYNQIGQKIGKWVEIHQNYFSKNRSLCDIKHIGEYQKGIKIGCWLNSSKNQQIGGGLYNLMGYKNGKWFEQSHNFEKDTQIIWNGIYENGKKTGLWNNFFRNYLFNKLEQIGGGEYDNNGIKNGQWSDITNYCSFIYNGVYKNCQKYGHWDIMYKKQGRDKYVQVGGGSFNNNGIKDGIWIELSEQYFKQGQYNIILLKSGSLITYKGEYLNGNKRNRWNILFKHEWRDYFDQIGGGSYDIKGLKQGQWIDLDKDSKSFSSLITYNGEYLDGIKQGFWKIMCWFFNQNANFEQKGGGAFNQQGIKDGKWIELVSNFSEINQITYIGDYIHGKKCGKWDIQIIDPKSKKLKKIGGGWFDVNGIKYGIWEDLTEQATLYSQVTFKGEYINGKKQGNWTIHFRDEKFNYFQIGGGSYDQNGMKYGLWIDLNDDFHNTGLNIFKGIYQKGQKFGIWEKRKIDYKEGEIIYDQNGIKLFET
ncbi:unnamed protein product [Paramecium sonneborni]|uniref:Uncharacterized protein n=1 Tax=Paramecium sonneborni TaxID=65129 RepID=A0A8S1QYQ0_9CILI|nr:unnamed protein product [Paramecium sonneborni]